MRCANDGNLTAYNGYELRNRAGDLMGWVSSSTVSDDRDITKVAFMDPNNKCFMVTKGRFTVKGGVVWVK
ncbi:hypothetical protein GCM10007315_02160 [Gemmobacter tilapiae]|uniref:Uncharacterized protein n=2 Tax=Neogemmobacter tilapiae TaxID=875041 RepID=A0A918TJ60_9RHOB|nr:hypothetical protein GCM10007315_02160 [Gemmobacter tilapiae]